MWWHDIDKNPDDLPAVSGNYLTRHADGSMELLPYTSGGFRSDQPVTAWTEDFMVPDSPCPGCTKAGWHVVFGFMAYTCDVPGCSPERAENPFQEGGDTGVPF